MPNANVTRAYRWGKKNEWLFAAMLFAAYIFFASYNTAHNLHMRFTTLLTDTNITRIEHTGMENIPVYCENFTTDSQFMPGDGVFHAMNAFLSFNSVDIESNEPASSFTRIGECITYSQAHVRQNLRILTPGSINEADHGTRFNGTAYYIGRWGSSNLYHAYIDTMFPVFIMLMAHNHLVHRPADDCCLMVEDLPPFYPVLPSIELLCKRVMPCPPCITFNGGIWADHVVVHFPFEARPMHVYKEDFPQSNGVYHRKGRRVSFAPVPTLCFPTSKYSVSRGACRAAAARGGQSRVCSP